MRKKTVFKETLFFERKSRSYSPIILLFCFPLDDDNDEDDMTMITMMKMMTMTKTMVMKMMTINLTESTAKVARHLCIENRVEA